MAAISLNNLALVFDCETTGFVKWADKAAGQMEPLSMQPHVVQLAAALLDGMGRTVAHFSSYVEPTPQWAMSDDAYRAHGISIRQCEKLGLPIRIVMAHWAQLAKRADTLVAHNFDFDYNILQVEATRLGWGKIPGNGYCTMREMTPIAKVPHRNPRGPKDYKWPTLAEAYAVISDKPLEGAHDAWVDVQAATEIFLWLRDRAAGLDEEAEREAIQAESAA